MSYKQSIPKKKDIKWKMAELDNCYRLLELRADIEYGTSYKDLTKKEQKEIAQLVAKDVA